jgi:Tfp pilus assembly protein PilN
MHNLLSKQAKKEQKMEYIGRLLVLCFTLGTGVVLVGMVALVPTFLSTRLEMRFEHEQKERLNALLLEAEAGEKPLEQLERGRHVLSLLNVQAGEDQYSTILREALDTRPGGISISSAAFNRADRTFTIQGLAENRDALVDFTRRLEASPRFARINLPISDLARSTDLTFRLTLTLGLEESAQSMP